MKLKFTVSTNINSQETFGAVDTPMLLLGKLTGHGLGSHFQALDLNVGGVISEEIEKKGFSGERGKHFVIPLDQEDAPEKIMVVGLGSPDKFDTKALSQVIGMAVANAIKQDCRKLSVPILPNRQTQGINLRVWRTSSSARRSSSWRRRPTINSLVSLRSNWSARRRPRRISKRASNARTSHRTVFAAIDFLST